MRFDLSEDQALLRSSTRDFLENQLPLAGSRTVMEHEPRGFATGAWRRLAEQGYLGLIAPASCGGQGLGAIELAIVLEEMGRVCLPGPFLDLALATRVLGAHPSVPEIVRGERIATIARDEAVFAGERNPAVRIDGKRIRGRKVFVPFAVAADALLVSIGERWFLAEAPFETVPMPTLDPGQRFASVDFDHRAVPIEPAVPLASLEALAAVGAAATMLGLMARSLELTLDYVRSRQAFGRPIGAFQVLQHRLADMLIRTESTRSGVYRAAWCLDAADPEATTASAAAKVYAGDSARFVCGEAIQLHGGIGFTWEVDLHFYLKRAKTLEQHYGSTEAALERLLDS